MASRTKIGSENGVDQVIGQLLQTATRSGAKQLLAWKKPGRDIRELVKKDYVRCVRQHMDYARLKTVIASFESLHPGFNREAVGMMSVDTFAGMAATLGVHFKAAPYTGAEGLALRGFYINESRGILKRPLIYVNTAHHPLAISATFCHELGHHFSSKLFDCNRQPVHFFFDADYNAHLSDPSELAADIMVSLAGYPRPIAQRIFETPWDWGLVARAKSLTDAALNEVRGHLRKVYGLDLMARIPPSRRLHYLAGMIHYAKLRWALLAEYDL